MRTLPFVFLATTLTACSGDSSKRRTETDAGSDANGGGGTAGSGGMQASGGGGGTAGGGTGGVGAGGMPSSGGVTATGGATIDASVEAGTDAATDGAEPMEGSVCDAGVTDAGASLSCSALLGTAPVYDGAASRLTVRVPGVPRIVTGTTAVTVVFANGDTSAYTEDIAVNVLSGDTIAIDLATVFDAGLATVVEVCELDLVDECGRHHVLDRFALDDAGNRAELLRVTAADGGPYEASCRLDFDLCND